MISDPSPGRLAVPTSCGKEPEQLPVDPDFLKGALRSRFGIPEVPEEKLPLDQLILTVLSQNTTDRNRDRVFMSLRAKYPEWKDVLKSSPEELERLIAPAGLGHTKSRRIWAILEAALVREEIPFHVFPDLPRHEAMNALLALDGVGPKTAACVLLFSFGIPAFPVDTHIYRVCGRLGLLHAGTDRVKAHDVLGRFFHEKDYLEIHLNIIKLGRQICRPRHPLCGECPLVTVCPSSNGNGE